MQPRLPEEGWPHAEWESELWNLIKIVDQDGVFDLMLAAKSESNIQEGSFWSEKGTWVTDPEEIMQIGETFWAKISLEIAENLFGYEELHTELDAGRIQAVSHLDLPFPLSSSISESSDELEMNHDGDGNHTQRPFRMSAYSAAFEHVYHAGVLFEGVLVPRIGVRARDNDRASGSGELLVPSGAGTALPHGMSQCFNDPPLIATLGSSGSGELLVPSGFNDPPSPSRHEVPILFSDDEISEISGGNDAGADADMLPVMAEQSHGVRLPVTQASQSAAPSSDNHHHLFIMRLMSTTDCLGE